MGSERKRCRKKTPAKPSSNDSSAENNGKKSRVSKGMKNASKGCSKNNELSANLESKTCAKIVIPIPKFSNSLTWTNSVLQYRTLLAMGEKNNLCFNSLLTRTIVNQIKRYKVSSVETPFSRRVTSIAWHPVYPNLVVAGSKGGELSLNDINYTFARRYYCPGLGPGGSVVGLKFSFHDPCIVYTASITGDIKQQDFRRKDTKSFLSTLIDENWFSSLDVCYNRGLIMSGDCCGCGYLISTSGEKVWPQKKKMHDKKISHVEFHPRDPNVFVTASIDRSVKLWDFRMLKECEETLSPTHKFLHLKGVNSACFSPSNGYSLLTTDQLSELRIYSAPHWEQQLTIPHPHRHFQHITPIKAMWHPIEDIVVVGRYPDEKFLACDERTTDYYDGSTGELLYRQHSYSGTIVSLNAFNISGDSMASGAGQNLIFWKNGKLIEDSHVVKESESETESESGNKPFIALFRNFKHRSAPSAKKILPTEKKNKNLKS